jgi:hypothetical protein
MSLEGSYKGESIFLEMAKQPSDRQGYFKRGGGHIHITSLKTSPYQNCEHKKKKKIGSKKRDNFLPLLFRRLSFQNKSKSRKILATLNRDILNVHMREERVTSLLISFWQCYL